jgi:hypothetical protein
MTNITLLQLFFSFCISCLSLQAEESILCNPIDKPHAYERLSLDVEQIVDNMAEKSWSVPNSCHVPTLTADQKSFIDPPNRCSFYSCANKSVEEAGICTKNDPNAYFINYGEKYCQRFSEKTSQKISDKGKVWLNKTLVCLQNAVISFCHINSCSSCKKIRELAYGSHADCYTKSGLCYLNPYDLFLIGVTPDIKNDVLNEDGLKQVGEVAGLCGGRYAVEAFNYTEKGLKSFANKAQSWAKKIKKFVNADNDRVLY